MSMSPRLLRPRDTAFTPRSISGLALWLDASDTTSTYTTDAGPVSAVASPLDIATPSLWLDADDASTITASGGDVTAWADKSASALSFTASGTPVTGSATLNGRNVIRFDNVADLLSATSVTRLGITSSYTLFMVARYTTVQTSMLMSIGRSNSPLSGLTLYYNAGLRTIEKRDAAWGTDMVLSGSLATANAALLATGTRSGTDMRIVRDGVLAGSTTGSTGDIFWGTTSVLIGNTFEGTFLGDIAEIIVYPTALTTAQRASVEAYLAQRWGISGVHAPATASSDPVGYWADKSGNGINLIQSTSTARPTRVSSHVNGRAALTFDGTDFLSVANSVALGNNTVIMVVREDASANYGGLISYYPATGNDNGNANGWVADLQVTDNVISLSSGVFAATWAGAFALPLSVLTLRRQTDAGNRQIIRANGVTNAVNANASTGTAAGILIGGRFQSGAVDALYRAKITVCEVLRWDRALTPAEYARVETALARKWGITLAPQVSNADAQDWINRVYANGGTVSTATAASVNQFCVDIENAPGGSIRDRFLRLNLFCGSFQGAFVPLYRSASFGGSPLGNATDTNLGSPSFLVGDYSESSGLQGNGSSKYLNTGVPMNFANLRDYHMSSYVASVTGNAAFIGADTDGDGAPPRFYQSLTSFASATRVWVWYNYGTTGNQSDNSSNSYAPGLFTGVGSPTANNLYVGASSVGSSAAQANQTGTATYPVYVFASNARNASLQFPANARLGGYSLGLAMTATQVGQYNTALAAFNSAMGRA